MIVILSVCNKRITMDFYFLTVSYDQIKEKTTWK